MSEEMKLMVDKLKELGKMSFVEGASEESIRAFEEKNNIQLPSQYKEWLSFSDGGDLFLPAGVQLYGVSHKPFIEIDTDDKPDDDYMVIGTLATGDPLLCSKSSETVAILNQEGGCIEEDEKYADFRSFLKDLENLLGIGE